MENKQNLLSQIEIRKNHYLKLNYGKLLRKCETTNKVIPDVSYENIGESSEV